MHKHNFVDSLQLQLQQKSKRGGRPPKHPRPLVCKCGKTVLSGPLQASLGGGYSPPKDPERWVIYLAVREARRLGLPEWEIRRSFEDLRQEGLIALLLFQRAQPLEKIPPELQAHWARSLHSYVSARVRAWAISIGYSRRGGESHYKKDLSVEVIYGEE